MEISLEELRTIPAIRVGFIPYTIIEDTCYCLVGITRKHGHYSDFGGRAEKNESALACGLRELTEESRNQIKIKEENITHSFVTNNNKHAPSVVIFVKCEFDPFIDSRFQQQIPDSVYENEMIALTWLPIKYMMGLKKKSLSISIRKIFPYFLRKNTFKYI